jgi:nicotinate phosphoribosyltransferase
MKTTNIPTSILQTDFYQFTMAYAYLLTNKANQITGFESFIRKIKPEITNNNFYIFNAEEEVSYFINIVKKEINKPSFFDSFWNIIKDKIDMSTYDQAKKAFDQMNKDFEYKVIPNGTKIYPMVPVFQFKGPKFIGQMLETPITNIINGRVGKKSYKDISNISKFVENQNQIVNSYKEKIINRAKEYRKATNKIILEAGYRRAPSFNIAKFASKIAIENNWNGTSNTSIFGEIDNKYINGTMAHSFVMSFFKNGNTNELEAFKVWDSIFPKSTILIDTYDTINAVKILIDNNIKPNAVRIDSDPIEELAINVRNILDNAGWSDVKIFLSGDITPEKLIQWEKNNIPFDICMAGTKYVNLDYAEFINPGFVYKVVEFIDEDGISQFPVKKASGKSNYPGLKQIIVSPNGDIYMFIRKENYDFGMTFPDFINNKAKVFFSIEKNI